MSCTALPTQLAQLRISRNEQEAALEMTAPPKKPLVQAVLDGIIADINSTQAALDLCLAQEAQAHNPVPQRILGTVEKIICHDAGKELGADEPYLLIASFDMVSSLNLGLVGLTLPAINVVKVGPWTGVRSDRTYNTNLLSKFNRPSFWNLSAQASPIAHPQDAIFLVACMEKDESSPDAIRGAVRDTLLGARANNTNLTYDAYVTSMVSNMTAAIDTARKVLPPNINPDDLIGEVQQMSLSTNELATLNRIEPVSKTLRFTQRKTNGDVQNDYSITFLFTV